MGLLQNELVLLSFVATFSGVLGEYCYNLNTGNRKYCSYGCCGYLDRDCCSANVALIVGMIVLAILIVSTIIAVICCCVRRRAAAGQVIQTNPSAGLVVTSTQQATAGQPMPYYAPQPGAYPPPQPGAYPPPPAGGLPSPPAWDLPSPALPHRASACPGLFLRGSRSPAHPWPGLCPSPLRGGDRRECQPWLQVLSPCWLGREREGCDGREGRVKPSVLHWVGWFDV